MLHRYGATPTFPCGARSTNFLLVHDAFRPILRQGEIVCAAAIDGGANELDSRFFPLLRGGVAAPYKQMSRYLSQGAAGEVRRLLGNGPSDLPGRADLR